MDGLFGAVIVRSGVALRCGLRGGQVATGLPRVRQILTHAGRIILREAAVAALSQRIRHYSKEASMTTQVIKDSSFRIIGYIESKTDGSQLVKDSQFRIRGYYEPGQNVTKDDQFRIVGYGNLLASFLGGF